MNSVALMVEEHKNIKRMLAVVREACNQILNGGQIDYDDFDKMIDFIRNYADVHHHGKEEKFLFKEMVDNLGPVGTKLVTNGMLVEHDWGRLFISELREALERVKREDSESVLDVIANAIGYTNHLKRHIEKEDEVVYTFAERELEAAVMERVNEATEVFEKEAEEKGIQEHYLKLLEELEEKYHK